MAYIVKADVESIFGIDNVKTWADLDNDQVQSKIDARVTASITTAEAMCNDRLRSGPYAIPISGTIPDTVKDICAKLAGNWLYDARGTDDVDADGRPISKTRIHYRDAMNTIRGILSGKIKLDLPYKDVAKPVVRVQNYVDAERGTVVQS